MPRISIKTRTVGAVEAWAGLPPGTAPRSNTKLSTIWITNRGLPYDTKAKRKLIVALRQEFSNFTLHLRTSSFENEPIENIQQLANYIERL